MAISYRQLTAIRQTGDRDQIDLAEAQFYRQIWMSNGTAKTTMHHRLDAFDELLVHSLGTPNRKIKVLDIGISSGITTADLSKVLEEKGIEHEILGIDISVEAKLYWFFGIGDVLTDSHNIPIQYDIFGRSIGIHSAEKPGARRVLKKILLALLRILFHLGRRLVREDKRVDLLCNDILQNTNISVMEMNVEHVDSIGQKFDIIRAANILNLSYFETSFLKGTIEKLKGMLNESGLLGIVRTNEDNVSNGTIYRLTAGRLAAMQQLGEGTELASIIHEIEGRQLPPV